MSLITVKFAICVAVFLSFYYIIPGRHQWKWILIGNVAFLWMSGLISVLFSILIAGAAYITGVILARNLKRYQEEKKNIALDVSDRKECIRALKNRNQKANAGILLICVFFVIGIWLLCKCGQVEWLSPLAISYYSFIAISYVTDVCQGKVAAEKSFLRFYTFLTYFPQLTEGPFSRYDVLQEKLMSEHKLCAANVSDGTLRMLYGYVKKLLLSDLLLTVITPMLEAESGNGYNTVLLILLLPLQQYADFSGCMDIVAGLSKMMGISLTENFRSPVFSKSIEEVWRRWHITLGAFCKDYIFYPVALNKKIVKGGKTISKKFPKWGKIFPTQCALIAVWTFIGIWHGFAWKYLLWGWMNLCIIMFSIILKERYENIKKKLHIVEQSVWWTIFCIVRTYLLFGVMEFVADVSSAGSAARGFKAIWTRSAWATEHYTNTVALLSEGKWWVIFSVGFIVLAVDIAKEYGKDIYSCIKTRPICLRMMLYIGLFYAILLLNNGGVDLNAGFAYANF